METTKVKEEREADPPRPSRISKAPLKDRPSESARYSFFIDGDEI